MKILSYDPRAFVLKVQIKTRRYTFHGIPPHLVAGLKTGGIRFFNDFIKGKFTMFTH